MAADYPALATLYNAQTGTLDQRLTTINAMTVAGTADPNLTLTAGQIFSAMDAGEWLALQTEPVVPAIPTNFTKASIIRDILHISGPIPCASGTTASNFIFNFLGAASLANLGALAAAKAIPKWQALGFPHVIDYGDVKASGAVS